MSTALNALVAARRPERNRRAFSGITRQQADWLAEAFRTKLMPAGNFNTVVMVGRWEDNRIVIAGTVPVLRDTVPSIRDEVMPAHEHECPTLHLPIDLDGFDLFRLCRSFGGKLERARKAKAKASLAVEPEADHGKTAT